MNLLSTLYTAVDQHCKFFAQLRVAICNNLEPTCVTCLCHLRCGTLLHRESLRLMNLSGIGIWYLIFLLHFVHFSCSMNLLTQSYLVMELNMYFCMAKVVIKKLQFALFPWHPCCVFLCYGMLNFTFVLLEWTEWLTDSKIGICLKMTKNGLCFCAVL
jgi:hypothetical protein